jgi:hypothetical protein
MHTEAQIYGLFSDKKEAIKVIGFWFETPASESLSAFISENLIDKHDHSREINWEIETVDHGVVGWKIVNNRLIPLAPQ